MNIFNIISNTQVSSLAIPNYDITHNTMGKLFATHPVILVDTSYWLYYRFFALRTWYKKAFPDPNRSANFDIEHNWIEDSIFMNKFRKLFIDNIKTLVKKYKTIMTNVVFCLDCSYKDIWRNLLITDYKATRPESLKKKGFNAFNVFAYIKKDYLPELQVQYGVKIIYHPKCEADDIIGHLAPFLVSHNFPMIYVIANDNDYLQICNSKIKMIKGNIKYESVLTDNMTFENELSSNYGEEYLIRKILLGDVSDNIRACNVNKLLLERNICDIKEINEILENKIYKTVNKQNIELLLKNNQGYSFFSQLLNEIRKGDIKDASDSRLMLVNNFYINTILMDFQMIPSDLQKELQTRFTSYL